MFAAFLAGEGVIVTGSLTGTDGSAERIVLVLTGAGLVVGAHVANARAARRCR